MYNIIVRLKNWKTQNIKKNWKIINLNCLLGQERSSYTDVFLSNSFRNGNNIKFEFKDEIRADKFARDLVDAGCNIFVIDKEYQQSGLI